MPVPKTERKFPKGFGPEDLSEVYAISESEKVYLLGLQAVRAVEGQPLSFKVFVTDEDLAEKAAFFRWEIRKAGNEEEEPVHTEVTNHTRLDFYAPIRKGTYFVQAHPMDEQKELLAKEHLVDVCQKIRDRDSYIEYILEHSSVLEAQDGTVTKVAFNHSLGGEPEATRTFSYSVKPLLNGVFELLKERNQEELIPLIESILYLRLLESSHGEKKNGSAITEWDKELALEVNSGQKPIYRMGLAKLTLDQAQTLYSELEIEDLFNLMRFPKSSVKLLAEYLISLVEESNAQLGLNNYAELATVYSQYKALPANLDPAEIPVNLFGKRTVQFVRWLFQGVLSRNKSNILFGQVADPYGNPMQGVRIDYYEVEGVEVVKDDLLFKPNWREFLSKQDWEFKLKKGTFCELLETIKTPKLGWFAEVRANVGGKLRTGYISLHDGAFEVRARQRIKKEIGKIYTAADGYFYIPIEDNNNLKKLRFVKKGYWDQEIDWSRSPSLGITVKMDQPTVEGARWMKEEDFLPWLEKYVGYRYYPPNYYPFKLPNAIMKKSVKENPKDGETLGVGCNSFTEGLLVKSWQETYKDLIISKPQHKRWMVNKESLSGKTRMLCLKPVEVLKMGERIFEKEVDREEYKSEPNFNLNSGWVLVQFFRNGRVNSDDANVWGDGHNVLLLGEKDGAYLSLEASSEGSKTGSGKSGPMFKGVDHIDALQEAEPAFNPGSNWFRYRKLRKDLGKYRVMYRLFIYDLQLGRPMEY